MATPHSWLTVMENLWTFTNDIIRMAGGVEGSECQPGASLWKAVFSEVEHPSKVEGRITDYDHETWVLISVCY